MNQTQQIVLLANVDQSKGIMEAIPWGWFNIKVMVGLKQAENTNE
jgi:hypothetical protein